MPRALFDFECPDGHITERYIDVDTEIIECPFCLEDAKKKLSSPAYFKIDGFRSGIDGDAWAKTRETNARKLAENNG